jgi:hypothetical protein
MDDCVTRYFGASKQEPSDADEDSDGTANGNGLARRRRHLFIMVSKRLFGQANAVSVGSA